MSATDARSGTTPTFDLVIADLVLARLVALSAVDTTGVHRVQTGAVRAARRAVGGAVAGAVASAAARVGGGRDARNAAGRPTADPGAVSVDHDGASITATVEVVLNDRRPVLDTVGDLHRRASQTLLTIAASDAMVCVLVVDRVTDRGTRAPVPTSDADAGGR